MKNHRAAFKKFKGYTVIIFYDAANLNNTNKIKASKSIAKIPANTIPAIFSILMTIPASFSVLLTFQLKLF